MKTNTSIDLTKKRELHVGLCEPQKYTWRKLGEISVYLAAIHLLIGLSLRYKEWTPMRGYYGLTWEDTMVSYERILWSHMRGYYGLLWEDTMVSHERILWSHTRGYYSLIREDTMVSYERILWSPMRGYYGLLWEDTMVSYERILWSPMRGYYGLTWEDTMVYWWKMLSALCRMAGSGSGRFRASCETDRWDCRMAFSGRFHCQLTDFSVSL